jgi:hypothetical protein
MLAFVADFQKKLGVMKKPSLASLLAVLVAAVFLPAAAVAVPMAADPITLSLSNPNQVTAAPSSGATTLLFAGSVVVDSGWHLQQASFDVPFNASGNSLTGVAFTADFVSFLFGGGTGTYIGNIFSVDVLAGTLADFYGYRFGGLNLSELALTAVFDKGCIGDGCFTDGGSTAFTANQAFSVLVTNGVAVPESGASVLLLGASLAGLFCVKRFRFA